MFIFFALFVVIVIIIVVVDSGSSLYVCNACECIFSDEKKENFLPHQIFHFNLVLFMSFFFTFQSIRVTCFEQKRFDFFFILVHFTIKDSLSSLKRWNRFEPVNCPDANIKATNLGQLISVYLSLSTTITML